MTPFEVGIHMLHSLLHLIRAIARAHASTRTTSLMRLKKSTATSIFDAYCLGHWNEKNETRSKSIKLNN